MNCKISLPAFFLILVVACSATTHVSLENILLTDDGLRIAHTYSEGKDPSVGIILLHMLNRDRTDYATFAKTLTEQGYPNIALDSRGHGESDGNWQQFSKEQYYAMVLDVKAAQEFLTKKGIHTFIVIGASIGANIALLAAAQQKDIIGVVALSPGLEYHDVAPETAVKNLKTPVFFVAAKGDEYAALSTQRLYELKPKPKEIKLYDGNGHGTQLFEKENLNILLLQWIKEQARNSI